MMLEIQIIGIGCHTCRRLEADVREIVAQMKLDAQIERVDDLEKILQFELMALPGLVINGQVVACGYSGKGKVERLIENALDS
jgi:small redox-active disulfide protein 2